MTRRTAAAVILFLSVAALAVVVFSRPGRILRRHRAPHPILRQKASAPLSVSPVSGPAPPAGAVRVTLFFPDQETGLLHIEERDVARPTDAIGFVRELFEELKKGPAQAKRVSVIPRALSLRDAYLPGGGLVVLDLSADEKTRAMGSDEELQIVAAIVNTTLQNVAETDRVQILLNGEPTDTFAGHVDLTRPLGALRSDVAR